MKRFFLYSLLALVTTLVTAFPRSINLSSLAQGKDCGNGLEQQFQVGDIGWHNLERPLTPVDLRKTPNGRIIGKIKPGQFFHVMSGPRCTNDGTSWWEIRVTEATFGGFFVEEVVGWAAEGEDGKYFLESAETASLSTENFRNHIELRSSAPVIEGLQQITYTGGGGGEDECRKDPPIAARYIFGDTVAAWDTENFQPGEKVQISVFTPDGSLYLQKTDIGSEPYPGCNILNGGEVMISWGFPVTAPAGKWQVEFSGESGTDITYTTMLTQHFTPWLYHYCENGDYKFVLDGFKTKAKLTISLVETAIYPENTDNWQAEGEVVDSWQVTTDDYGQLIITFSDEITHSSLRWLVVEDKRGNIWGDSYGLGSFDTGFSDCNDNMNSGQTVEQPDLDHYSCPGAAVIPLTIGGQGRLTPGLPNKLRDSPSLSADQVGIIPGEGIFAVLDGPECADGLNWWLVEYQGTTGWTADGKIGDPWIEPYP